jgi:ATP-dependent Clp protease adaptor protein ClpS
MTTESPVIEKRKTTTTKRTIKEPSKYKVIVLNDDFTPMEFVIAMFITVFNYDQGRAHQTTMEIHHRGSAVAGIYSHEIAEQKCLDATNMARDHGYPLVIKTEEV